jgi:hypothetical protein
MKTLANSIYIFGWIYLLAHPLAVIAVNTEESMSEDKHHINNWNQFADRLQKLHEYQLQHHETYQKEGKGGYMGNENFYREVKYFDKASGKLLSRVLWEVENPDQIHEIEVFLYGDDGRLKRDYLAAFYPVHRNAPVQTLINLHYHDENLHSFRQFDASGEKIYERCEGTFQHKPVNIALDDNDFWDPDKQTTALMKSKEYKACFGHTAANLGDYVNPLYGLNQSTGQTKNTQLQ